LRINHLECEEKKKSNIQKHSLEVEDWAKEEVEQVEEEKELFANLVEGPKINT
jgi:uncharacterized DUF497 family protein